MAPLNEQGSFFDDNCCSSIDSVAPERESLQDSSVPKPTTNARDHAEPELHVPDDAFLRYSDDEIRMKTLKLDEASADAE
eukprot:CAMPEP_0172552604 /NCGR_PEP_ID=MMETSP1067-20121228/46296_1 /TAXON_ID=265564 ORGANISM="Thalassiosira punctigera, Strain Tpunct2005C2" /NCGR_SAMPLE_ID=MMETSP1067 /ASSEMBLY_ACC=CAM_ASM_000444 /LENGTH=79 /DNA_ID=CAMNT_0013340625 /DNA_START=102 /DNA_END=341 /DNA_ORIENTATION=-